MRVWRPSAYGARLSVCAILAAVSVFMAAGRVINQNVARGFEAMGGGASGAMTVACDSGAGERRMLLAGADCADMTIEIVAANRHSTPRGRWRIVRDGRPCSVTDPAWMICVSDSGSAPLTITVCKREREEYGGGGRPVTLLTARRADTVLTTAEVCGGVDCYDGVNVWRLLRSGGMWTLCGGAAAVSELMSFSCEGLRGDSVGVEACPGAELVVHRVRCEVADRPAMTSRGTAEKAEAAAIRGESRLGGVWRVLDRSMDESLLRLGGDYELAIVPADGKNGGDSGYELVYLSGARVSAARWKPGMVKGRLLPSGISGVYDLIWVDAECRTMESGLKAQAGADGTLRLLFPYQASEIRLTRVR